MARGVKKPRWPSIIARAALRLSNQIRIGSGQVGAVSVSSSSGRPGSHGWAQMYSQNARSCVTRVSGGLPAMTAALSAPIEIPAIQFG
ncbi:hypothetical protein D3C81_1606960 [compost metagenome]